MADNTSVRTARSLALDIDSIRWEIRNYYYIMWFALTRQMPSERFIFLVSKSLEEIEDQLDKLDSMIDIELNRSDSASQ